MRVLERVCARRSITRAQEHHLQREGRIVCPVVERDRLKVVLRGQREQAALLHMLRKLRCF